MMRSDSWETAERPEARTQFFFDTEAYPRQGRSLRPILYGRLCPACQADAVPEGDMMARLEVCCSRSPGFISGSQPVQERVFRLLLANGGQAMSVADIAGELKQRAGSGGVTVSEKALISILGEDTFYGIRAVGE